MRRLVVPILALIALTVLISRSVLSQPTPKATDADVGRAAEYTEIVNHCIAFAFAYNAHDAKAIAALFTPDGRIEDKDGNTSEGRDAIEKTFAAIFAQSPKCRIIVTVDSVRFLGADLAVEVGTTKTTNPDEAPDYDKYTVLHVKRDGKWMMAFARDEEGPPATGNDKLQPLAWLVGDWVDDGGSAVVNSTCKWSDDGMFLLQEFKLHVNGKESLNVSQRIGWDPLARTIRSWVFDSAGGFGEGVWLPDGDNWIIKANGIRPDGSIASATNYMTRSGADGYVWQSVDRVVGNEMQAPIEVKVVRKPPQPKR